MVCWKHQSYCIATYLVLLLKNMFNLFTFLSEAEILEDNSPQHWAKPSICKMLSSWLPMLQMVTKCNYNYFSFAIILLQESPTPTKLMPSFSRGLSDSRRSKLTAERHQASLLFHFFSKSYTFSFWHSAVFRLLPNFVCLFSFHLYVLNL